MNTSLALPVAGTVVACLAIAFDLAFRHGGERLRNLIERMGRTVHIRQDATPVENLRQFFAVGGATLLGLYAVQEGKAVYTALQALLVLSSLLWYPRFWGDPERVETLKSAVRIAFAVLVWLMLEWFGLCPGFHRLGVIGLELLGCGFVTKRPVPRDAFCFAGSVMLSVYPAIGLIVEPESAAIHTIWLVLNLIYGTLAGWALVSSLRKV